MCVGAVSWRSGTASPRAWTIPTRTARYRGWADLVAARLAVDAAGLRVREPGDPRPAVSRGGRRAGAGRPGDEARPDQLRGRRQRRAAPHRSTRTALVAQFDEVVGELRSTGADVVLFRFADVTARLPGQRIIGPRAAAAQPGGRRDRGAARRAPDRPVRRRRVPQPGDVERRPAAPVGRPGTAGSPRTC